MINVKGVKVKTNQKKSDRTESNQDKFYDACIRGHLDIVLELLKVDDVDPAAHNSYGILWSSYTGKIKIVDALLKDGRSNPAARNNFAIKHAAERGFFKTALLLSEQPEVKKQLELDGDNIIFDDPPKVASEPKSTVDKIINFLFKGEK